MPQPLEQPLLDDGDEWGVLLYYKFVALADPAKVAGYFQRLCASLSLRGRLRIAPDGVNVTVTGTLPALRAHIAALHAHPRFAFPPIDFKLSPAPPFAAVPPHLALACGFASLSVRLVPHLITLAAETPPIAAAGPLVSPLEFHSLLQNPSPNCVLIDARNIYEIRIGKFCPPPHVQFFDPLLRQYSDLAGWIDAHQEQLRNKRVLMYCTGGVRCELASSYLRSKGKEFEDVIQLSGGIHRYMEAFADGGYFKGKNFVFDHRMAVATSNEEVVGRCLLCNAHFDDYSARNRCSLCRLLVLICTSCQGARDSTGSSVKYVCELCEVNQKASGQPQQIGAVSKSCINDVPTTKDTQLAADLKTPLLFEGRIPKRKLRLLCLHGFRQNASSFKGRLGSLQKKLKHVADFVFVDAPHKLPFIQQGRPEMDTTIRQGGCRSFSNGTSPTWKYAWLVSPSGACGNELEDAEVLRVCSSHGSGESEMGHNPLLQTKSKSGSSDLRDLRLSESMGEDEGYDSGPSCSFPTASGNVLEDAGVLHMRLSYGSGKSDMGHKPLLETKLGSSDLRDLQFSESMGEDERYDSGPSCSFSTATHHVTMKETGEGYVEGEEANGSIFRVTKTPFDAWQYESQTEGWDTSWEYLQKVFQDLGPFDGVLGFSQGAAVAAALCQLRQTSPGNGNVHFKFAVLCSGYAPGFLFPERVRASEAGFSCPSLHIYGDQDRQINDRTSERLANLFRSEERTIVKHSCGHIIPTQPAYIEQYLQFLRRFL